MDTGETNAHNHIRAECVFLYSSKSPGGGGGSHWENSIGWYQSPAHLGPSGLKVENE